MRDPYSVGKSAVSMMSLAANGTPQSGPLLAPPSHCRACASANSSSRWTHALTCDSRECIRSRQERTKASDVRLPSRMRAAASLADKRNKSAILFSLEISKYRREQAGPHPPLSHFVGEGKKKLFGSKLPRPVRWERAGVRAISSSVGERKLMKPLLKCPNERFCSLKTGEICVYGIN